MERSSHFHEIASICYLNKHALHICMYMQIQNTFMSVIIFNVVTTSVLYWIVKFITTTTTHLINGVKNDLCTIGMSAANIDMKPCNQNRHHNHKQILNPWISKAFPVFPQKNANCRQINVVHIGFLLFWVALFTFKAHTRSVWRDYY